MERQFRTSTRTGASDAMSGLAAVPSGIMAVMYQMWLTGLGIAARTASEAPRIIGSLAQEGARVQRATMDLAGRAAGASAGIGERVSERMGDMVDMGEADSSQSRRRSSRRRSARKSAPAKSASAKSSRGSRGKTATRKTGGGRKGKSRRS
jgi:hypothetical protein